MIKPRKGLVLIEKLEIEEEKTASGFIFTVNKNINPYHVRARVIDNNSDNKEIYDGALVLAQFVALTQIKDSLYVIPADYIDAIIEED